MSVDVARTGSVVRVVDDDEVGAYGLDDDGLGDVDGFGDVNLFHDGGCGGWGGWGLCVELVLLVADDVACAGADGGADESGFRVAADGLAEAGADE